MTELKTLKDLEHLRFLGGQSMGKSGAMDVSSGLLKQEAIKWIKEMEKSKDKKDYTEREFDIINGKIHWIKYFFNIKEELK